jgi:hypothetical protein
MSFWKPNIESRGRIVRGFSALAMLVAAGLTWKAGVAGWPWVLAAGGAVTAFEALRGWCVLRACGIKTRL